MLTKFEGSLTPSIFEGFGPARLTSHPWEDECRVRLPTLRKIGAELIWIPLEHGCRDQPPTLGEMGAEPLFSHPWEDGCRACLPTLGKMGAERIFPPCGQRVPNPSSIYPLENGRRAHPLTLGEWAPTEPIVSALGR